MYIGVDERDTFTMHSVNKRHLSPSIALHFVFYVLRSLGRFMLRFMLHTERAHRGIDAPLACVHNRRGSAYYFFFFFSLSPANHIALPCRTRSLSPIFTPRPLAEKRFLFTARKIGWFLRGFLARCSDSSAVLARRVVKPKYAFPYLFAKLFRSLTLSVQPSNIFTRTRAPNGLRSFLSV